MKEIIEQNQKFDHQQESLKQSLKKEKKKRGTEKLSAAENLRAQFDQERARFEQERSLWREKEALHKRALEQQQIKAAQQIDERNQRDILLFQSLMERTPTPEEIYRMKMIQPRTQQPKKKSTTLIQSESESDSEPRLSQHEITEQELDTSAASETESLANLSLSSFVDEDLYAEGRGTAQLQKQLDDIQKHLQEFSRRGF
eukprot:TRINITY_DN1353_c0_g1_i1.p1 TRINITY_DN1353_c0_g1~~TRINITY_DN1353_c0_g1_i1.p1  ORF type:complete len:201 (-),score=57.13 TRINITY_DN1353_c0_g1_i1:117-719(-)